MSTHVTSDDLRDALVAACRAAVDAAVNRALTPAPDAAATFDGWSTPLQVTGALEGTLTVWLDTSAALALARAMTGLEDAPEASAVAEMVTQLWRQAAETVAAFPGVHLEVGRSTPGTVPAGTVGVRLMDGSAVFGALAVSGALAGAGMPATGAAADGALPGNLAALLDIDLPLVARFARTELPLRARSQLGPGSMVDMGCSPDAAVQLLIGGQVIAEGEVVVVGGNYGVRITSLASPADRLRAMDL